MVAYRPTTLTASTTLSQKRHGDGDIAVNIASGATLTLPAATGSGTNFRIFVQTTITSNSLIVKVANATDVMVGSARVAQDAGDTAVAFETAADSDTITMNGSTTGGIRGDFIELKDMATGIWRVAVTSSGTGTEATPFSATVS